ncbi:hypothetical protein EJ08DRAFT_650527 [Tothia fuscella]|uniref:3-methyl-2-oxobutanoate hydroxymethyltransferase n=1 Tax=Tothia fuscella TaxID=1048955 RepID=A0A9P4NQ68_9PEZI|nr:hypothetical protein EJ08DRAFT_650527 [Tothia fuscella]
MSRAFSKRISLSSSSIGSLSTRSQALRVIHPLPSPYSGASPSQQCHPQHVQTRYSSHSPLGAAHTRKKVTLQTLQSMYKKGEPITMLTAYDFPSAHVADHAGMDIILVGDSLAMVSMGLEDTSEVSMEEMIFAARSAARATKSSFLVGDLPMGSYEISPEQALASSIHMIKTGRTHAIKLEGGASLAPTISKITSAGIPVLGHIGLTPQRQNSLGGFRVQGKTTAGAMALLEDAFAVQDAGAFGVVLEAIPPQIAEIITRKLRIPTIGIGAGASCSGQVLVQTDMLGNFPPGRYLPKFVKRFGDVWAESLKGIEAYGEEVKNRTYPAKEHTYDVKDEVVANFEKAVEKKYGDKEGKVDNPVAGLGRTAVP